MENIPKFFHCGIPDGLKERIEKHKDNVEDVKKVGVEWCIEQSLELIKNGAPSLHFYANRKSPIEKIIREIR